MVAGNGPSALTLSFFLNGNWPYYDGQHPDEVLHARLSYEKDKSIMDMVSILIVMNEVCHTVTTLVPSAFPGVVVYSFIIVG